MASTSGNAIRRAGLALGMAWTAASGCAPQRGQRAPLSPPPTPAELGLAALALQDSSIGPFFPPERLADNVALRRRVRHQSPVVVPAYASELSWHPSLQFQMPDSLFRRLFDANAPQSRFVDRWLNPPRTGWAAFDSITAALGDAVAIQIQDLPPTYGFLTVYYREPVNIPGVARAYAGLAPAVTISIFQGLIITTNDVAQLKRIVVPPAQQDTARPPVPRRPNLPDDSTLTVPSPSGMNVRYYRNIVLIAFDDSTSGGSVRRILHKYGSVIIGGSEARDEPAYYVRIPDPGATFAAIDSVASRIQTEPGVRLAYIPTWRGLIRIR